MSLNYNEAYNLEIRKWIEANIKYTEYLSKKELLKRDCPICKSSDYSHFANNGYLNYSKCNHCSLVFMNPTLDQSSIQDGFSGGDELIMSYFKIMKKYKKFDAIQDKKVNPKEDNKLKDIYSLKENGKLLDIGCSVGDFLHKAKYFYEVEGVEVNPETSKYAAKYFTIYTDYLNKLELSKSYDIVTLNQILYGVPDNISLLTDIHKILKDDGILYINTPNSDSFAVNFFGNKVNHLYGYTTQNIFNLESITKLASLSGFKIKTFRTEWLDIYSLDIAEFYANPDKFIHKRNIHLPNYIQSIKLEDEMNVISNIDLKNGGNYLVTILEKI